MSRSGGGVPDVCVGQARSVRRSRRPWTSAPPGPGKRPPGLDRRVRFTRRDPDAEWRRGARGGRAAVANLPSRDGNRAEWRIRRAMRDELSIGRAVAARSGALTVIYTPKAPMTANARTGWRIENPCRRHAGAGTSASLRLAGHGLARRRRTRHPVARHRIPRPVLPARIAHPGAADTM